MGAEKGDPGGGVPAPRHPQPPPPSPEPLEMELGFGRWVVPGYWAVIFQPSGLHAGMPPSLIRELKA